MFSGKKGIIGLLILFCVILLMLGTVKTEIEGKERFAGGIGAEDDPYLISTPDHLDNVRNHLDKHFTQIADIDLSAFENWDPIGSRHLHDDPLNELFSGFYDGNGYIK